MSGFWVVTWQLHCLTRKKIFCFKLCSGNTDTARLTVLESLKWDIAQWKEDSSSWSTLICFHTCLLNVSFVVPFTITYIDFGLYCGFLMGWINSFFLKKKKKRLFVAFIFRTLNVKNWPTLCVREFFALNVEALGGGRIRNSFHHWESALTGKTIIYFV